jgi:hypothetical protein
MRRNKNSPCQFCAGEVVKSGFMITKKLLYQRLRCNDCHKSDKYILIDSGVDDLLGR